MCVCLASASLFTPSLAAVACCSCRHLLPLLLLLSSHPDRYMFQYGHKGAYCLGVIDSQWGGLLIGGVATRNVLVKVRTESESESERGM